MNLALAYYRKTLTIGGVAWKIMREPGLSRIEVKEWTLIEVSGKENHIMVFQNGEKKIGAYAHHYNDDWFPTEAEAIAEATEQIEKNIRYHQDCIQELEISRQNLDAQMNQNTKDMSL